MKIKGLVFAMLFAGCQKENGRSEYATNNNIQPGQHAGGKMSGNEEKPLLALAELYAQRTKSLFSPPVQIDKERFLAVALDEKTVYEFKQKHSKGKASPLKNFKGQVYGLIQAAPDRLALLVYDGAKLQLEITNFKLERQQSYEIPKGDAWDEYWVSLSKLCVWQNQVRVLTNINRIPTIFSFSEDNRIREQPLLKKKPKALWYVADLLPAKDEVLAVLDSESGEIAAQNSDGTVNNEDRVILGYDGENTRLRAVTSVFTKAFVFDGQLHFGVLGDNALHIYPNQDRSNMPDLPSYPLKLQGTSFIHDITPFKDASSTPSSSFQIMVSVETGLEQASGGSIYEGGWTTLLLLSWPGNHSASYTIPKAQRRTSITHFFPCNGGQCGLLYNNRPLTHDHDLETQLSLVQILRAS